MQEQVSRQTFNSDWSHRNHSRQAHMTGFQTAGLIDRTMNVVTSPIDTTMDFVGGMVDDTIQTTQILTPDYWVLDPDGSGSGAGSDDPLGFDRFGTPVYDEDEVVTQDPEGVGPLGIPTTIWFLGGATLTAGLAITMTVGEENAPQIPTRQRIEQAQL